MTDLGWSRLNTKHTTLLIAGLGQPRADLCGELVTPLRCLHKITGLIQGTRSSSRVPLIGDLWRSPLELWCSYPEQGSWQEACCSLKEVDYIWEGGGGNWKYKQIYPLKLNQRFTASRQGFVNCQLTATHCFLHRFCNLPTYINPLHRLYNLSWRAICGYLTDSA